MFVPQQRKIEAENTTKNTVAPFFVAKPKPVFPDFSTNYQKMLAVKAQEAAQAIVKAQVVYYAPTQPTYVPAGASDVQQSIMKWSNYYGVNPQWLLNVVRCESGFRQGATNYNYSAGGGHPHGIAQFLPQTFFGNGGIDYESYDDQARVMAYMFSIGQSGQWECK